MDPNNNEDEVQSQNNEDKQINNNNEVENSSKQGENVNENILDNEEPSGMQPSEMDTHNMTLEDVKAKIASKEAQLMDLNQSIQARQTLLNDLREIGKDSIAESPESFYFKISQLEEEINVRDSQIVTHLSKIDELEDLLKTTNSLKIENENLTEELQRKEEDWINEKERLEEEIKDTNERIEKMKEENNEVLKEAGDDNLDDKLAAALKNSKDLELKIEQLEEQNGSLDKENSDLKAERETEANLNEEKMKEMAEMIEALKSENSDLKVKVDSQEVKEEPEVVVEEDNVQEDVEKVENEEEKQEVVVQEKIENDESVAVEQNSEGLNNEGEEQQEQPNDEEENKETTDLLVEEPQVEDPDLKKSEPALLTAPQVEEIPESKSRAEDKSLHDELNKIDEDIDDQEATVEEDVIQNLENRIQDLELLAAQLEQKNSLLLSEGKESMNHITQLSNSELQLQRELRQMEGEIRKHNKQTEVLSQELETTTFKLTFAEERIEKLTETLDAREVQEEDAGQELLVVQEQMGKMSLSHKKLQLQIYQYKRDMQRLEAQVESYKKTTRTMKLTMAKADRIKFKAHELSLKANNKVQDITEDMQELQKNYDDISNKWDKYKDNLAKKDDWIIRQGDQITKLNEKIKKQKVAFNNYKKNVESSFDEIIHERDTEIQVLKEMIYSTKSMMKAKEVDIARLKRKLQHALGQNIHNQNYNMGGYDPSNGARQQNYLLNERKSNKFNIKRIKSGNRPNSFFRNNMNRLYSGRQQNQDVSPPPSFQQYRSRVNSNYSSGSTGRGYDPKYSVVSQSVPHRLKMRIDTEPIREEGESREQMHLGELNHGDGGESSVRELVNAIDQMESSQVNGTNKRRKMEDFDKLVNDSFEKPEQDSEEEGEEENYDLENGEEEENLETEPQDDEDFEAEEEQVEEDGEEEELDVEEEEQNDSVVENDEVSTNKMEIDTRRTSQKDISSQRSIHGDNRDYGYDQRDFRKHKTIKLKQLEGQKVLIGD